MTISVKIALSRTNWQARLPQNSETLSRLLTLQAAIFCKTGATLKVNTMAFTLIRLRVISKAQIKCK
ncbi:hypothetical protein EBA31_13110 [Serratia sp. P2ACOL2]|nr:hypothetical protein EBA31_13110 [Serratia sp. P2ACOL2]